MKNYEKVRVNQEVLQSLVFYFMMSIYLRAHDVPESVATQSLTDFIKDCRRDDIFKTPEAEATYLSTAYQCLPGGFLELIGMEGGLGDGIKVIDTRYAWINKL
jgi:hypothetical protein